MKTKLSVGSVGAKISNTLYRYHLVLFVLFFIGGLAVVILLLAQTVFSASDVTENLQAPTSKFDQTTIDQLEKLQVKAGENGKLNLPNNNRINPFAE